MRWVAAALMVGIVGNVGAAPSALRGVALGAQTATDGPVLERLFAQRVDDYVALHRHLERLLPPEIVTSDLDMLFAPRLAMAREMRQARHGARQGEIFTPALEMYFRTRIEQTLQRNNICDMLAIIDDENSVHAPASVNGDYPAGRSVPCIPASVLAALPTLPSELRYSFVGRDLVLWDVHAGLIVDFVPRAVPRSPTP
jgi:hypothetical protein